MGNGTEISHTPALGLTASAVQGRKRAAVRSVSVLLLFRGMILAGGIVAAALVPRAMGPASYGRYDLITGLTFFACLLGGFGLGQVTSRQAPELAAKGDTAKLRALFSTLLVLRALSNTTVALLYLVVMRLWLQDLDWTVLCALSLVVLLRGPANLCYALFLGQGRIARWALPELLRQWGSVLSSLPGFLLGGLRGAVLGYLLTETVIFTIALLGARRMVARRDLRVDWRYLAPVLGVGIVFWVSEVVSSASDRYGSVLVRSITHDYAQVGLYGVSYQMFTAAALGTSQLTSSFVHIIGVLRSRHEDAEVRLWVERLVKWLAVLAMLGFLGSLLLGRDLIPLVLGRAYAPVVANMVAMAAAMLLLPLVQVCSLLALTHDRPGTHLKATLLRLCGFWGLGIPLGMLWGSLGACMAVGGALTAQASYYICKNWGEVGPAFRRWAIVIAAGLIFLPLALLRRSPGVDAALYLVAASGFLLVLRGLGVISTRELGTFYRSLVSARGFPRVKAEGPP